jgi:hypothetical protein
METTLYDKSGRPQAYISNDSDRAIYTWDGRAICYIENDKIYGWKGKHIGWYINEIIYDNRGLQVGFTKKTCPSITYIESIKSVKYVKNVKYIKFVSNVKPVLSYGHSNEDLKDFLSQNKV